MHTCTDCGAEFEGNFCPECGAKRVDVVLCPRCFSEIKTAANYCTACGLKTAREEADEAVPDGEALLSDVDAFTEADEPAESVEPAEPSAEEQIADEQPADEQAEENAEDLPDTEQTDASEQKKPKFDKFTVIRKSLYFAPVALFSLFSILLWAFFAAPAATYDGQSYGNIYNFAGDGEYLVNLNACARAMIAFAVIAVAFSAFALCARLLLPLASKKFAISSARFRLTFAVDCAQCLILSVLFIISAVLCGMSASAVSKTGAAGPLVLSFSLFFLILVAGATVADFVLRKYLPAYAEAAQKHEDEIDSCAKLQAERIAEQLAAARGGAENTPVFEKEKNKKQAVGMFCLEKGKAFLRMYVWFGLVLAFALVMYNFHYDRTTDVMNNAFLVMARICVAAVIALAIGMLIHIFVPARVPDKKRLASLRTGYVIRLIWSVLLAMGILAYALIGSQAMEGLNAATVFDIKILGITYAGIILSLIFLCAVPLALSVTAIVMINKAEKKYFSRLEDGSFDNGLAPLAERNENRIKYVVYMYDSYRTARRAASGKSGRTARQYKRERALIAAAGITSAFALAAVIFFAVIFAPHNIYKLDRIENVCVGDSMGYVYRTLGEPFDKEERGGNGEIWAYCSDSLAGDITQKTKQLDALKSQMNWNNVESIEKLQGEIALLQARLESRRCSYIYVTFQSDLVVDLAFEKNRRYSDGAEKEVSKITYACESVQNSAYGAGAYKTCYYAYEEKITVSRLSISQGTLYLNVREYFKDGSLLNKIVKFEVQPKIGLQTVDWSDEYGEHTLYLAVR